MRCEYFIGKVGLFDTSDGQEYLTEGGLQGDIFSPIFLHLKNFYLIFPSNLCLIQFI